jgi:hypothetical protein
MFSLACALLLLSLLQQTFGRHCGTRHPKKDQISAFASLNIPKSHLESDYGDLDSIGESTSAALADIISLGKGGSGIKSTTSEACVNGMSFGAMFIGWMVAMFY